MEKNRQRFWVNLGLLVSGFMAAFSGLAIQIGYHMGNHGSIAVDDRVFGIDYHGWSEMHEISIVFVSMLIVMHTILHGKFYETILKKGLFAKNEQVLTLSVIFVLVALTGYIPWLIHALNGDERIRKLFDEIHDKLALLLVVYLMLHLVKRLKWYFTTYNSIRKFR